jgi:hypothetical protein
MHFKRPPPAANKIVDALYKAGYKQQFIVYYSIFLFNLLCCVLFIEQTSDYFF